MLLGAELVDDGAALAVSRPVVFQLCATTEKFFDHDETLDHACVLAAVFNGKGHAKPSPSAHLERELFVGTRHHAQTWFV